MLYRNHVIHNWIINELRGSQGAIEGEISEDLGDLEACNKPNPKVFMSPERLWSLLSKQGITKLRLYYWPQKNIASV